MTNVRFKVFVLSKVQHSNIWRMSVFKWCFRAHHQQPSGAMCEIAFKLDKLQFSHYSQFKLIIQRVTLFNTWCYQKATNKCDSSVFIYFSFVSGITLLGTPTEIYVYGVQYMFVMLGVILMGIAMTYIYLPVFIYSLHSPTSSSSSSLRLWFIFLPFRSFTTFN